MGILFNIGKKIQNSIVGKTLDTVSVALAHPIQTISAVVNPNKKVSDLTKEFNTQSTTKKVAQIATGTVAIGATVAGGATLALGSKAGALATGVTSTITSLAKSLVPKSALGKVAAIAAVPIAAPVLISSPKAREKLVNSPSELAQFGTDLGKLAEEPSTENLKNLVKESPIITTGILTTLGIVGAKTILPALQTKAVKEQTEAINKQTEAIENLPTTPVIMPTETKEIEVTQKPAQPSNLAETKTITSDTPKKARKRSRIKKNYGGNVNQRVNVIVSTRNSSVGIRGVRYLNERIYN